LKANQTGDAEPSKQNGFPHGSWGSFTAKKYETPVPKYDSSFVPAQGGAVDLAKKVDLHDFSPYTVWGGNIHNGLATKNNKNADEINGQFLAKSNGRWVNGNGDGSEKWDFVEEQNGDFNKISNGKVIDLKSENQGDKEPKSHPMGFTGNA
jgi:hypothetical protein